MQGRFVGGTFCGRTFCGRTFCRKDVLNARTFCGRTFCRSTLRTTLRFLVTCRSPILLMFLSLLVGERLADSKCMWLWVCIRESPRINFRYFAKLANLRTK
jgi:hypothetical protein